MKFTVSSHVLLGHLQVVSKVIGGKPMENILNNILLDAKENMLYATATDKETTIIATIELDKIDEDGRITISAKLLLDILKEFAEQPLTFDINTSTNEVKIISESGEFIVVGENAENYPQQSDIDGEVVEMTTTSAIMLEGLSKTLYATASDELRPVMNCVLLEMGDENYTFVASDSHKLVRYKRFDAKSSSGDYSLVIPKKPANMLKNTLAKDDSELKFSFTDKMATFGFANYRMTMTLVEGRFPNYNSVIPQNNDKKAIVERKQLSNILRRVAVVANQASNLARFDFEDGKLIISAQDMDYSMSGHEEMACQYEGESISIGFKTPFVVELLANISTEYVEISMSAPGRPGLFLPYENDNANEDSLMLLMPMMV